MSLFGKLWDREPQRMMKLNGLLTDYGNLHYQCGEYDHDASSEDYSALVAQADKAKQAIFDYVAELRRSPLPQSDEGKR